MIKTFREIAERNDGYIIDINGKDVKVFIGSTIEAYKKHYIIKDVRFDGRLEFSCYTEEVPKKLKSEQIWIPGSLITKLIKT